MAARVYHASCGVPYQSTGALDAHVDSDTLRARDRASVRDRPRRVHRRAAGADCLRDGVMKRRWSLGLRALVIAVVVAGLWWFVRGISWADLGRALGRAMIWPLVIAAALNFVCLWGKAACWRIMLAPDHVVEHGAADALHDRRVRGVGDRAGARGRGACGCGSSSGAIGAHRCPATRGRRARREAARRRDDADPRRAGAVAPAGPAALGGHVDRPCSPASRSRRSSRLYVAIGPVGAMRRRRARGSRRSSPACTSPRSPQRLSFAMGDADDRVGRGRWRAAGVSHAVGISAPRCRRRSWCCSASTSPIAVPSTPASVGALEVGMLAAMRAARHPGRACARVRPLYHALQVLPLIAVGLALELRLVLGREPRVTEVDEVSDPLPAKPAPDPTEARSPR